mmetsp:Transcript_18961/g.52550  ORF Transcript_18961/g.52550 Transcript_18961/m.52550 type:complete len:236 (-) Transcript_18961:305-1012(-)
MPEDLGCHVRDRAAAVGHALPLATELAQTKINELDEVAILALEQEVFQFEVPVCHALAVQVAHGQEDLPERVGSHLLREVPLRNHAVKKLPTIQLVHDKSQGILALIDVREAGDVRVVHTQGDFDLVDQHLPRLHAHRGQVQVLDRNLSGGVPVRAHQDVTVTARAQHFAGLDHVVFLQALRQAMVPRAHGSTSDALLDPDERLLHGLVRGEFPNAHLADVRLHIEGPSTAVQEP